MDVPDKRWRAVAVLALSSTMTACMAPGTPKPRTVASATSTYVVTDARQRVVLNADLGNFSWPGLADPNGIVCSEPSPARFTSARSDRSDADEQLSTKRDASTPDATRAATEVRKSRDDALDKEQAAERALGDFIGDSGQLQAKLQQVPGDTASSQVFGAVLKLWTQGLSKEGRQRGIALPTINDIEVSYQDQQAAAKIVHC